MKKPGRGLNTGMNNKWLEAMRAMSYQTIAGELAGEMMGFMRSSEPRKCSPPFNMVIIDNRGTVVFECNVSKDGKIGLSELREQCCTVISRRLQCLRAGRKPR